MFPDGREFALFSAVYVFNKSFCFYTAATRCFLMYLLALSSAVQENFQTNFDLVEEARLGREVRLIVTLCGTRKYWLEAYSIYTVSVICSTV